MIVPMIVCRDAGEGGAGEDKNRSMIRAEEVGVQVIFEALEKDEVHDIGGAIDTGRRCPPDVRRQ